MAESIYQSVRLLCVTVFLIALLQLALPMGQLWVFYQVRKFELRARGEPQIQVPTFRAEPREERL